MRTALEIVTALCDAADLVAENRNVNVADAALRLLQREILEGRMRLSETHNLIDYQASSLIDCLAALCYARTDGNQHAEERALVYVNSLRTFLRMDLNRAARMAVMG